VLATKLVRPFTLIFSQSLGFKNIHPKVLYLLHASAGQWLTVCSLSSFSSPHSWQSCHSVSPSSNIWLLSVVWTANSPTPTLSFDLLVAWSTIVLFGRSSLISLLDWLQPSQAFQLFTCLSEMSPDGFFAYNKAECNTYCSSTVTSCTWFPLNVTLYVHWLSCCYGSLYLQSSFDGFIDM
jgi:hypothetical protein